MPKSQRHSIQDGSAYIFVPYNAGKSNTVADDSKEPGAILRLGGYSSIEQAATDRTKFYPENHNTAEGGNNLTNAAGPASGGYRGGILLSCDGRMLIRAGEKLYLQSVADMDIDSNANMKIAATGTVTVEASDVMMIRTYNAKGITISADAGAAKLDMVTATKTETHIGHSFTVTDKNEYKLIKADSHTYRLGSTFALTGGTSWSVLGGASGTVMSGVALSFNLSVSLALKASFDITLYLGKMDVGIYKFDVCAFKTELKAGKIDTTNNMVKAAVTKTDVAAVKTDTTAVESTNTVVDSGTNAVTTDSGGPTVRTRALSCYF